MKKFLTVLLALSVVFTYTVGTAFAAAAPTVDQKTTISTEASKYADRFDAAATAYMNTLTFDSDNMLSVVPTGDSVATGFGDVLTKTLVQTYVNKAKNDAIDAFNTAIANLYTAEKDWTPALISSEVQKAYNEAVTAKLANAYVFSVAKVDEMVIDQLKADKETAIAALAAYTPSLYSTSLTEWSITIADATNIAGKYNNKTISGLEAGAVTARAYVEGIVKTQKAAVDGVSATDTKDQDAITANVTKIGTVAAAAKTAKDVISGHKITSAENYYIEAVPTIADLAADTSVASAKSTAITRLKAKLASKRLDIEAKLNNEINAFTHQAKLSNDDAAKLANAQGTKEKLTAQFAALEEVYTARINNCTTTSAVNSKYDTLSAAISGFDHAAATTTEGSLNEAAKNALSNAVKVVAFVADLKAEATLLAQQKDVNGNPFYDAAALAENLEEQVAGLYEDDTITEAEYNTAVGELATGFEKALADTKVAYIKFIDGSADNANLAPKATNGSTVTAIWNKATGKASADASSAITAFTTGTYNVAIAATDALYDDAQKEALTALVKETTASIEKATTVAEIKSIFAAANDKYDAIETVNAHKGSWNGKLGTAYTAGKYNQDLFAYATYFTTKNDMADYPAAIDTATEIMNVVVYPIIYTAYTSDELTAKVAEAKAAIDKMLTTAKVAEQKKAVEALIAAIPATVTLDSKAAIIAAADANQAYEKVPGFVAALNKPILTNDLQVYADLLQKDLESTYDALANKMITTADADAIAALRTKVDEYEAFCKNYDADTTPSAKATDDTVATIEGKLVKAQVAAVKALMIQLSATPTTAAEKAAVKAAREAFDALPLVERAALYNTLQYQNLIDAEEYVKVNAGTSVEKLKLTASSKAYKGKIVVKWTVKGDATGVKYQVYKSTKKFSGYKKAFTTSKKSYSNTKQVKKGTRYYYKVRAIKVIDGKTYYSDWSNKAQRVAK